MILDVIYFLLPSLDDPNRSVFGISCYRQISAKVTFLLIVNIHCLHHYHCSQFCFHNFCRRNKFAFTQIFRFSYFRYEGFFFFETFD